MVEVDGVAYGQQGDHRAELWPGDLSVVDLSQPFRCVHQPHCSVSVTFPQSLMPLPRQDLAHVVGRRIPGGTGTPGLVSTLVRRLPHLPDADAAGSRLGTAVLDLLTAAVAARLERASVVPSETRRRALVTRIEAFVEARLSDAELTPATIADAHHISLRYLHRLFEAEDHGVAGRIRQRRLDRCRTDLLDPALADRSVAATAARWGFTSAAHFTRVFQRTYGLPPGEYRRAYAPDPG